LTTLHGPHHVSETALAGRLGLAPDTDPTTALISLARKQGISPFEYLRQVQQAISELLPITSPHGGSDAFSEPGGFGDEILAALLVYGCPVLGLTLMLGAMGMPFPSARLSAATVPACCNCRPPDLVIGVSQSRLRIRRCYRSRRRLYQQPGRASPLTGDSCRAGIHDPAKSRAAHDREMLAI
jgi:hypothetical protein